jgi:hypothetical protein
LPLSGICFGEAEHIHRIYLVMIEPSVSAIPWRYFNNPQGIAMTEPHQKAAKADCMSGYTAEDEFAAELNVARETLRKWRRLGKVCAYIVVGRQVYYDNDDKLRWLKSLKVTPPRSGWAA